MAETYVQAGKLDKVPIVDNQPAPQGPAAPGQRDANQQDTVDDPMREMQIVFAGDQLTHVRFARAKDLLAGSHTPSDRFEHCSPFKSAMWQTKASLLEYSYSFLYKPDSVNQVGTLKYFREKYNRKNVTPSKVLDSFEGSEELFLSIGRAYIVAAILSFFGMSDIDAAPTIHQFPDNISCDSMSLKKEYFDDVFGKFVGQFYSRKLMLIVIMTIM